MIRPGFDVVNKTIGLSRNFTISGLTPFRIVPLINVFDIGVSDFVSCPEPERLVLLWPAMSRSYHIEGRGARPLLVQRAISQPRHG